MFYTGLRRGEKVFQHPWCDENRGTIPFRIGEEFGFVKQAVLFPFGTGSLAKKDTKFAFLPFPYRRGLFLGSSRDPVKSRKAILKSAQKDQRGYFKVAGLFFSMRK